MYDKETGEPVIYCNTYLEGTNIGSPTDLNGLYNISKVPNGNYKIVISYIGYDTLKANIQITENKILPKIENGDKRVFIINGKVCGAISRVPKKGSCLSIMSKGAKPMNINLTKNEKKILESNGIKTILDLRNSSDLDKSYKVECQYNKKFNTWNLVNII